MASISPEIAYWQRFAQTEWRWIMFVAACLLCALALAAVTVVQLRRGRFRLAYEYFNIPPQRARRNAWGRLVSMLLAGTICLCSLGARLPTALRLHRDMENGLATACISGSPREVPSLIGKWQSLTLDGLRLRNIQRRIDTEEGPYEIVYLAQSRLIVGVSTMEEP